MAYRKGKQIETGIWRLVDGDGYVAEVNYTEPETGQRHRLRKTWHRIDQLRTWRQVTKTDLMRGTLKREKKRKVVRFSDFAEEYLRIWGVERKESTVKHEKNRIRGILIPRFGDRALGSITRKDIESFLAERRMSGKSKATSNRELCRLKNMLRKAKDWDYIDLNPAVDIRQERESIDEADYLTKGEAGNLIEACDGGLRPLVATAVYTGMRWGELMSLEWQDVDLEREQITVRKSKNDETRHVPMNGAVVKALWLHRSIQATASGGIQRCVFSNPQSGQPFVDLRKPFYRALKAAGITRRFTFHGLRHTAASHMAMNGVDLRSIGAVLGHKDPKVTVRYAHLAPDHLRSAVDLLDFSVSETA